MSIALSDTQIAQILTVSRPLQPQERTAFMAALFQDLLNRREEVGDGELGRTLRDLQHRYFQPPTVDERETVRADSRSFGFRAHHLHRRLATKRAGR